MITCHTWLGEMHSWLQTNALATSHVKLENRMDAMQSMQSLANEFQGDDPEQLLSYHPATGVYG